MQHSDDGHFCFVELLVLEEVSEHSQSEGFAEFDFSDFVSALSQVSDKVEVLDEVGPRSGVFFLTLLIELAEG